MEQPLTSGNRAFHQMRGSLFAYAVIVALGVLSGGRAGCFAIAVGGLAPLIDVYFLRRQKIEHDDLHLRCDDTISAKAIAFINEQVGLNAELLETAHTDLEWLHDAVYHGPPRHTGCPACKTTIPNLEDAARLLRTVHVRAEQPEK